MRQTLLALCLTLPALLCAQSLDRGAALTAKRAELTATFAKAQGQLKSKNQADWSAAEASLSQLTPKIEALRDELVAANQALIQAFSQEPLFHGAYDPSATIIASLSKMMTENRQLAAVSLPSSPPYNAQDLNKYQQALDRLKRGIDEHTHAAQNHAATVPQRQRKAVPPAKKPAALPQ